jgi:hypothetical protein
MSSFPARPGSATAAKPRALVLSAEKSLFNDARARFAEEVEYIDLVKRPSGSAWGDGTPSVPTFEPDRETLRIVDALMATRPFAHVLATSESNLAFAAFLRSRYGLAGLRFDQALIATNKYRMKRHLRGTYPTAPFWLSGDFVAGAVRRVYPPSVVIKPLSGSASKGVRLLSTSDALEQLASCDELLLVEEAIDVGGELHCDGVVRDGQLRIALPSAYDRPVLTAAGTSRASLHLPPDDPRWEIAQDAARRITGALGIADFVFHLELLQSKGKVLFGEIGLRPAGGGVAESLRYFFGVDIWDEFVRIQLNRRSGISPPLPDELKGYGGVIGIAADGSDRGGAPLTDAELLAIAGIVHVSTGSSRANSEARLGSSCAFSQFAFFDCDSEQEVHQTIAHIDRLRRESGAGSGFAASGG